jgi:glucose dehydrogenase
MPGMYARDITKAGARGSPDLHVPLMGYRPLVPLAAVLCAALPAAQGYAHGATVVDDAMLGAEADGTNWPAYGRTFSESRFSPLRQVNDANVSRLGLA